MDFPPWQHDANQSGFENDNTLADLATVDPIPGPSRLPFDPSVEASSLRKLTTLRFHGRTGTVPGFERCEIDSSPDTLNDTLPMTLDQHTLPRTPIIQHILNLYFTHFACRFPFFVRSDVREDSPQFPFLFHCIGALVARFSDHPEICDPSSPRHTLGKIFLEQARRQVGSMMGIPSRETILGLLLLVEAALGSGSRTEMWMFMGMASKTDHVEIPETDRYRDRLLFWSVLVMDYSLSFAEGRKTSIRSDEITQELPREDEMPRSGLDQDEGRLRSPFPFAAEMIMTFGPAIDIFNDPSTNSAQQEQRAASIRELRARVAAQYDELPLDMMWNAANLQKHYRAGQGAMYLFLHLWNHTIQCSKYLYDPGKEVESIASFGPTGKSDQLTVQSIQAGSWLHCARFVGDMLVLADVIDPHLYLAIPSVNYCFFVAGRCFSEDLKARQRDDDLGLSEPAESGDASRKKEDMARALFKAITFENIKSLKQGIAKQAAFWRGIGPTLSTFESDVNALPAPAQPLGSFQQTSMLSADRLPVSSAVTGMHLAQTPRADGIDLSRPDPMSADNRIMSVARNSDLNAMFSAFQSSDLSSTGWSWLNSARPSAAVSPMDIYQLLGMEKG
nr:uncharacterized protein CI109_006746 [Kwoniella shandongensis]KAA5524946.1 hypothetical protein CI109_006746 [Kwoniella shandongensis]